MNPNHKDLLIDLARLASLFARVQLPRVWQGELLVLAYLERNGGKDILPLDIKLSLQLTSARVSVILNGLEKKGFVERMMAPGDRRKVLVKITAAGIAHYNDQLREAAGALEPIAQRMGREDMDAFLGLLHKLTDILEELDHRK